MSWLGWGQFSNLSVSHVTLLYPTLQEQRCLLPTADSPVPLSPRVRAVSMKLLKIQEKQKRHSGVGVIP